MIEYKKRAVTKGVLFFDYALKADKNILTRQGG